MIDEIIDYINSKVSSYVPIKLDILAQSSESIILRQLPSESVVDRYMDDSRASDFEFLMIAKSMDQLKAIDQLKEYENILDLPEFFDLAEGCQIKIEQNGNIVLVGINDDQSVVYSNSFIVNYLIEGK